FIHEYTGVSIPSWVLDLSPAKLEAAVEGELAFQGNFKFGLNDSRQKLHLDELASIGKDLDCALDTTGEIKLVANADFTYAIGAELPGKKVIEKNPLGKLLTKLVGGASFEVHGTVPIFHKEIPVYSFDTAICPGEAATNTPLVPEITVQNGTFNP